jgi:hypothetical protein
MTPRQRLMATVRREKVDRPAVCLYELNGLDQRSDHPDPYHIYADPTWKPLLELTRERTDRIVMRGVQCAGDDRQPGAEWHAWEEGGSRYETMRIVADGRELTARTRRDRDVDTVWQTEHLLKDADDLAAYLTLPELPPPGEPDPRPVHEAETSIGESGIVMIDTPDPICQAASLFDMGVFTVLASTEPELFTRLVDRFAAALLLRTEAISRALPGRLWRIYGPEYAVAPYLHPRWFRRYVVPYDRQMIELIHDGGGFARIHAHGRVGQVLTDIVAMGADAIDPLEPPPQGDSLLSQVRADHPDLVLFGNIEIADIEGLEPGEFRSKVESALHQGAKGGRPFVLMPSASPYGRHLAPRTLANYRVLVEMATGRI